MDNEQNRQFAELTGAVAHSAEAARVALDDAERLVLRRNDAVRVATHAGVTVGRIVSVTGLSRAEVYRIIDRIDDQ